MERLESYITVSITEDGVEARMLIKEVDESFQCTTDQLVSLLNNNRVSFGIDMMKLSEVAMAPGKYVGTQIVVARGQPAVAGEDGSVIYHYERKRMSDDGGQREQDKVDLRNVTRLDNVKKGELLAEKIPPGKGTPGKGVNGELIVPPAGKEARFKIGKNVVMNKEETKLYAAIDGLVSVTEGDKINVFPIYEVNGDVDYKVGNIDFNGTVVIRGSVLTGFRIKANGDIRVSGTVDGAHLEAEGSITIAEGIVGQNKGEIRAARNVKCSFMQDAVVHAGEDVLVSQSIMHSQVSAGHHVICSNGNGLIVGGSVRAGDKVIARTIGNSMSTHTSIEVGVHPELRNELSELRTKQKSLAENLDKSVKALKLLDQLAAAGKLDPGKMEMRKNLEHTQKRVSGEMDDIRERLLEIEKRLESTHMATVEVGGTIYPGTKLVIGRAVRFIKDPVNRVRFHIEEGEISFTALY